MEQGPESTTKDLPGIQPQALDVVQREVRMLRVLLVATLVSLLLLSFSVNMFLFRAVSLARKDRDSASAFIQDHQLKREPLITNLVASLEAFARTHPDFNPILEKYGIKPTVATQSLTPLTPLQSGK